MPELFDMISGTETGAIIAGSLVIPNEDKTGVFQYADKSVKFFETNHGLLYVSLELNVWLSMLISVIFAILLAIGVYVCLVKKLKIDVNRLRSLNETQLMILDQIDVIDGNRTRDDEDTRNEKINRL